MSRTEAGGRAVLVLLLLLLCAGAARAQGGAAGEPRCAQGYAQSFAALHEAASALRLKAGVATEEVARLFRERPARCEPGAYAQYLGELMRFLRRALRSGATLQTPKEGWLQAAQGAMGFAPRTVPQGEYYEDLERFQGVRAELGALVAEAGAGAAPPPAIAALLPTLAAAQPQAGAYGPPAALAPPAEPPPEAEPPPSEPPSGPSPPTESPQADAAAGRAAALFRAGQYLESAEELRRAYQLLPRPLYLFNRAQAYRRGGLPREALASYREFLEQEPRSPLRAEARGYATDMEALLREQARAAETRRALEQEQGRATVAQRDLAAARARAERAERERRPVYRRGWFWGVMTAGALVAVGVGLGAGLAPRDPPTDGGIINLSF